MNFAMRSRRAALASLFSFVAFSIPGCVATDSVVDTITVPPTSGDTAASQGLVQESDLRVQLPRELTDRSTSGLGISATGGKGFNQLSIDAGAGDVAFEVKKFSAPDRLVIDMPSQRVFATAHIPVTDLELLSGIRIGSHPGKSRVVIDLAEGAVASHDARLDNGKIVVTLRDASSQSAAAEEGTEEALAQMRAETASPAVEQEASPQQGPAAVKPVLETETESLPVETVVNEEQSGAGAVEVAGMPTDAEAHAQNIEFQAVPDESIAPTTDSPSEVAAVPAIAAVPAQGSQVTEVMFNRESNQVEVKVKGQPEYNITRTAPSEYVLTLKDTALMEGASEPEVVQSEGSGIRSIRTTSQEADTLVRVFAQPTSYLTAHRVGDMVVIQETNDIKKVSDDIRAQIDPAKAAETAVAAPTVEPKLEKPGNEASTKPSASNAASADDGLSDTDFSALLDDSSRYSGRLISLDLQDTDIDNALRIIAEVSNLNIVASDEVAGKVTLRLTDVPWDQALDVILKTNGLDKVLEGNVMRIAPVDKLRAERESFKQARQAEEELEPLVVKYLRVSYAKAAELKSLVETVLSERGSVAYDERSNQLIVKDVRKGLKNVIELVKKVDLRTPQVLLETQIVEAKRNLTRELGSELGFQYIQSPSTGNGTGLNFPSAIAIGGSAGPGPITASSFPASAGASAVSMLFDSADGTKSLELRLSQLEQEGRVRIISRPAVATTNNKPAEIKSVEKIRIKLPSGGLSVATGSGATASGSGTVATQTIEAGITLNVTPQASPDYFVLLDIKANSSSFSSEKTTEGIPNEIARSASSTVLVSSGQTFALGGIYKIIDNDDLQGTPFFKDIPFLGTFFRRSTTRDSDEELLFFITPRIVEGSFDDASMKSAL